MYKYGKNLQIYILDSNKIYDCKKFTLIYIMIHDRAPNQLRIIIGWLCCLNHDCVTMKRHNNAIAGA